MILCFVFFKDILYKMFTFCGALLFLRCWRRNQYGILNVFLCFLLSSCVIPYERKLDIEVVDSSGNEIREAYLLYKKYVRQNSYFQDYGKPVVLEFDKNGRLKTEVKTYGEKQHYWAIFYSKDHLPMFISNPDKCRTVVLNKRDYKCYVRKDKKNREDIIGSGSMASFGAYLRSPGGRLMNRSCGSVLPVFGSCKMGKEMVVFRYVYSDADFQEYHSPQNGILKDFKEFEKTYPPFPGRKDLLYSSPYVIMP